MIPRRFAVLLALLCIPVFAAEKSWPQKGDTVYVARAITVMVDMVGPGAEGINLDRLTCRSIRFCEYTHPPCAPVYITKRHGDRLIAMPFMRWETHSDWPDFFRGVDSCNTSLSEHH